MSILSDLYKKSTGLNWGEPFVMPNMRNQTFQASPTSLGPVDYKASDVPLGPANKPAPVVAPSASSTPLFSAPSQPQGGQTGVKVPPNYINPETGQLYSAKEIVENMASRIPTTNSGDIGTYAGGVLSNPNQTPEQLRSSAYDMNNARNDIATGETDPYKAASQSGMSFSGAELDAIEKAYAGVYDPALKDVFNKLEKKERESALEAERKYDFEKMAKQHEYSMAEKAASGGGLEGPTSYKEWSLAGGLEGTGKTYAQYLAGGGEGGFKSEVATTGRQAISNMLKIAEANPGIFGRTAALPMPDALRTDAFRNYQAQLDSLKGNIIPAALTAMREASKTGGALGQVSDREGAWLSASLGALEMAQSPEQVVDQLKQIDEHLALWEDAVSKYGGSASGGDVLRSPDGTQEVSISDLTPEELQEAQTAGWR
jgi:hypothetical protein